MFARASLVALVVVAVHHLAQVQAGSREERAKLVLGAAEREAYIKKSELKGLERHLLSAGVDMDLDKEIAEIERYRATAGTSMMSMFKKTEMSNIDKILAAKAAAKAPKCTLEEYNLYEELDTMLGYHARKYEDAYESDQYGGGFEHIEHAAHAIITEYLSKCLHAHMKVLLSAIKGVDSFSRKTSESLTNLLGPTTDGQRIAFNDPSLDYEDLIASVRAVVENASYLDVDGIVASIKRVADPKDLPKSQAAVDRVTVKRLFQKYVLDGCWHYVSHINRIHRVALLGAEMGVEGIEKYPQLKGITTISGVCNIVHAHRERLPKMLLPKWTV